MRSSSPENRTRNRSCQRAFKISKTRRKISSRNVVKCVKYGRTKYARFVYFCITCGILLPNKSTQIRKILMAIYFAHFRIFRNETLPFYQFLNARFGCSDGFYSSGQERKFRRKGIVYCCSV